MDPLEAAAASGDSINGIGTHFMMDMDTYVHGGELGYAGADYYIAGRAGALGDVPADVVTAAFVFWNPEHVAAAWERTAPLLPRREAAQDFASVAHRWAEAHVPKGAVDCTRLAELAARVADAAGLAGAPLFAGWRTLDEPAADRPEALAVHRVNALRELRGAMHGAAVLCQGIRPDLAVARRTPYMLTVFGWPADHEPVDDVKPLWAEAQAATDRAMAHAYAPLTDAERTEFVQLVDGLQAAIMAAKA